ncbi:MAG: MFS transporter [Rhizobiales bacterium]|nr:MFS transporter [Hyphomicrobiales bacterium]
MRSYFSFLLENARWLIGGFMLCFFSSFGQTFFISLSGGYIRSEFGLSNGEFGTLFMAATLVSAICITQLGKIVDVLPNTKTIFIVLPILALACLGMAFTTSIIGLFIVIFFLRLFGQGMMTHTSIVSMGRWYSGHRGRAVSLATMGHQGGEAILPVALVILLTFVSWRTGWIVAAGICVFVALPAIYLLMRVDRKRRSTDVPAKSVASRDWTRAQVMRDPIFWALLTGVLMPPFIGTTLMFHQAYLVELRGWAPQVFASAFVFMAIFKIIFALITGFVVDKFGSIRLLPFSILPLACGCFIVAFMEAQYSIYLFMGVIGMSVGIASTLFGSLWPEVYGIKNLGSIRSVIMALMVFATALGPGITGVLIDLDVSYLLQFAYMGAYCIIASFILWVVSQKIQARD